MPRADVVLARVGTRRMLYRARYPHRTSLSTSLRSCNLPALRVRHVITDLGKPASKLSWKFKYALASSGITKAGRSATTRRVDTERVRWACMAVVASDLVVVGRHGSSIRTSTCTINCATLQCYSTQRRPRRQRLEVHTLVGALFFSLPFSSLAQGMSSDEINALTEANKLFLQVMGDTVYKYTNQCGRRWVDLGALFSVMKL